MIAALGQHGHGLQAIVLFEQMLKEDIVPDLITFLTIQCMFVISIQCMFVTI